MLRRVKWAPVTAILTSTAAVVAGILGADAEVTIPTGLLAVTIAIVSRDTT